MESSTPPSSPDSPQAPPPIPPAVPPSVFSSPSSPSPPPVSKPRKTPIWQLALLGIVVGTLFSYVYVEVQEKITQRKNAQKAAQQQAEEAARPHKEMLAQIEDLRLHGSALPPCPLVYPLLDRKGKVTPLGSYLSYFSMKQASYLPKTVFSIPNAGVIFNEFDLFTAGSPKQLAYRKQLPFYFANVKDFGEGKLLKAGSGWKIQLRFWGTKPEKKYSKAFPKGKLHLAIGWMASRLQDYMAFQPTPD